MDRAEFRTALPSLIGGRAWRLSQLVGTHRPWSWGKPAVGTKLSDIKRCVFKIISMFLRSSCCPVEPLELHLVSSKSG